MVEDALRRTAEVFFACAQERLVGALDRGGAAAEDERALHEISAEPLSKLNSLPGRALGVAGAILLYFLVGIVAVQLDDAAAAVDLGDALLLVRHCPTEQIDHIL